MYDVAEASAAHPAAATSATMRGKALAMTLLVLSGASMMYNGLEDGYTGRDDIEYLPTGQPLFAAMHHGTRLEVGGSIYRPHGLLAKMFSGDRKVDPCVNLALSLRFGAHSYSLHLFFLLTFT